MLSDIVDYTIKGTRSPRCTMDASAEACQKVQWVWSTVKDSDLGGAGTSCGLARAMNAIRCTA